MRLIVLLLLFCLNLFLSAQEKPRLVVLAYMGNEPDGDTLTYNWWVYPEAGTYKKEINILGQSQPRANLKIPKDSKGTAIHLILEVKDKNSIVSLSDYRRIVIEVDE